MSKGQSGKVRVAIIGAGAVSDYHHVPAIKLDPRAELAGACDSDPALLERRKSEWGIDKVTTDPEAICADPDVNAVIIATPNFTHLPIALAAARHGKHMMCEKPLGVNKGEVEQMYEAAPGRQGRPHDGVHLSVRAVDESTSGTCSSRGRSGRLAISGRSGSSTGRRRAGAGGSTRTRPAPATSTT